MKIVVIYFNKQIAFDILTRFSKKCSALNAIGSILIFAIAYRYVLIATFSRLKFMLPSSVNDLREF